jgi:hypothetical protein
MVYIPSTSFRDTGGNRQRDTNRYAAGDAGVGKGARLPDPSGSRSDPRRQSSPHIANPNGEASREAWSTFHTDPPAPGADHGQETSWLKRQWLRKGANRTFRNVTVMLRQPTLGQHTWPETCALSGRAFIAGD